MDSDDKTKTGCAGILIPLFFAAYALKWILSERAGPVGFRNVGNPPMTGDVAVGFGVMTLGICLFVHALGFVPYERIRGLKYILAAGGLECSSSVCFGSTFTPDRGPAARDGAKGAKESSGRRRQAQ